MFGIKDLVSFIFTAPTSRCFCTDSIQSGQKLDASQLLFLMLYSLPGNGERMLLVEADTALCRYATSA